MTHLKQNILIKGEGRTLTPATPEDVLNKYLEKYPNLKQYVRGNKKASSKKGSKT